MTVIARLLITSNPDLYMIFSSGTLGNPDWIAKLFFESDEEYLILPGTGRRGTTSIKGK